MKLKDALYGKDHNFWESGNLEFRAISTDGKGGRDDVFTGFCQYVKGELICSDRDKHSMDDEVDGVIVWKDGNGINFNGVNINATVWSTQARS